MSLESANVRSDGYSNSRYRYYALALLTTSYMFNFVDRQILSILQEPIKADLGLSDTQLGLLTGFAFAVFYIVMGLPIARWADRGNRRNIIAYSVGLWSFMTAACGLAQNYWQLLLARIGVGVGEAGCSPPSHSMIADIFPMKERATAIATYNSGVNIGMLVGFLMGGWIQEYFGWRVALMAVGIPGILLALVIKFTVKEPQRQLAKAMENQAAEPHPTLLETIKLLWSKKTFRYMVFAGSLASFSAYSLYSWTPSFLIRSFGMSTGTVGNWLALTIGVGGALGTFSMGYVADRLGLKDCRWYPGSIALAYGLPLPLVAAMLLSSDGTTSLLFFIIPAALQATYLAPLITVTHSLVKPSMRAVSSAVVLLMVNLIGLGFGPVLVGGLSDYLEPSYGNESLRYSLLFWVSTATLVCLTLCALTAKHIRKDMAVAED